MNYNKVEICGVNTSKLKVLTEKEKRALLTQMKNGTPQEQKKAREELINGNLEAGTERYSAFYQPGRKPGRPFPGRVHRTD